MRPPWEPLIAHSHYHEQALARSTARQVVRERCRGLVGGVQIVDGKHDAPLSGGLLEQLGDRREDAMAVHGSPPTPPPDGAPRGAAGKRGLRVVGERAGQLRAPRRQRLERLHERRVRRAALLLVGGAAERVETELLRLSEHGLDEAGLADPERARDEQRAAIGGSGTPQRGGRRSELALTPFDGGVKEPDRPHRRATRELALERERRLLGGLRAEPRRAGLAARGTAAPRPAGRRSPRSAHERGGPPRRPDPRAARRPNAPRSATARELALAQSLARAKCPLLVALVGQQLTAIGGIVAALEAFDVGRHLGSGGELDDPAAHDRAAAAECALRA